MSKTLRALLILMASVLCVPAGVPSARAGEADVIDVKMLPQSGGLFRIVVTVRHTDAGWDHYADRWDVVGPQGIVLAKRKLWHPHVDEQPFTRELSSVKIPPEVLAVKLRARDSVHGYGGQEIVVKVPR